MLDLSFWQIFLRAIAAIVIITLHGFALAAIARLLGDRGPQHDGRLSLSPLAHVEALPIVCIVFARAGWVRQMAIDPKELRGGRWGLVACAVGALAVTLLAAHGFMALRPAIVTQLPGELALQINAWILTFANLSGWFAVFSLLPIPPLTGGYLLAAAAPELSRRLVEHVFWIGIALAIGFFALRATPLSGLLSPIVAALTP